MPSLLDRLSGPGPVRNRGRPARAVSAPYETRPRRPVVHDLYNPNNDLSARLAHPIPHKALKAALPQSLSIKGASTTSNVVEVSGLVHGTTPADVAIIFQQCGNITTKSVVAHPTQTRVRLTFSTPASATKAVQMFNNKPADGNILTVKIVPPTRPLGSRLGGADGLGLVREEGSVDVLMNSATASGSKMRSDSLVNSDPRAQVLVAPPGADPKDYMPADSTARRGEWKRGGGPGGRGRGRRGKRGGGIAARMNLD